VRKPLYIIPNIRSAPGAADRRDLYLASDGFSADEIAVFVAAAAETGEVCCFGSAHPGWTDYSQYELSSAGLIAYRLVDYTPGECSSCGLTKIVDKVYKPNTETGTIDQFERSVNV